MPGICYKMSCYEPDSAAELRESLAFPKVAVGNVRAASVYCTLNICAGVVGGSRTC